MRKDVATRHVSERPREHGTQSIDIRRRARSRFTTDEESDDGGVRGRYFQDRIGKERDCDNEKEGEKSSSEPLLSLSLSLSIQCGNSSGGKINFFLPSGAAAAPANYFPLSSRNFFSAATSSPFLSLSLSPSHSCPQFLVAPASRAASLLPPCRHAIRDVNFSALFLRSSPTR